MFRGCLIAFLIVAVPTLGRAAPDDGKLISESWEHALLEDGKGGFIKVGHVHFTIRAIERNGQTIHRATKELRLTIRRGGQVAKVVADTGTEETLEGKVVGVFMRQGLGQEQTLVMTGTVVGDKLQVKVEGQVKNERDIPWNGKIIGLIGEQQFLKNQKARPGDAFDYLIFEPTLNAIVTVRVKVLDFEDLTVVGGKHKTLKVVASPDKIQNVQLPASTIWADGNNLSILQSEVELPGLGKLRMVRTTKEQALAPVSGTGGIDLIATQSISLNQSIPQIHTQRAVTYRLSLDGTDDVMELFSQDRRQEAKKVDGAPRSIDLTVEAVRKPTKVEKPEPAGDEFIKSNYFINSADETVQLLAKRAVGDAKDPWEKAKRVERYVNQNMKSFTFSEALMTADQVAKNLSGDCTEYAMLTAAMCRAQGIPSRTAIGLVYVESRPKPTLAFHMWTEVNIDGQWLAIDATLGYGSVGPGHLKITDASWHDIRSFTPLLPVMRVILAKPKAEVVRVYRAE